MKMNLYHAGMLHDIVCIVDSHFKTKYKFKTRIYIYIVIL